MGMLSRIQVSPARDEAARTQVARHERAALRKRVRASLAAHVGLDTLTELCREDAARSRDELTIALEAVLNDDGYDLGAYPRDQLIADVLNEIVGLGPLQPLIDDPGVTEVMVNGTHSLFYEREGRLVQAQDVFDTQEQIMVVIDRILAPLGRRLDEANPLVSARLSNGDRVHAVMAPIALDGPTLTIRRFTGHIASLERLVALGSLPAWYAQLLRWAVRLRQDIAVAGGTGSGKTTLLNALSVEIDEGERIITIEDAAELQFDRHPHVVRLEARDASIEGRGRVSIRDLVTNSLRMRPDRIVVGEVRGEECIDMLQAMNTGHDGSLTTLHAGTAEEVVLRLVMMARFGMDLPAALLEEQVATALDVVVMSKRLASGERRVTSMYTVRRSPEGRCELHEVVSYSESHNTWHLTHEPPYLTEGLTTGQLSQEEVRSWRMHCA